MSDPKLDSDEFDVLIEALEAWVQKDAAGEILAEVVTAVVTGPDYETKGRPEIEKMRASHNEDRGLRKERAILIQAKLIQMRDQLVVERFAEMDRKTK